MKARIFPGFSLSQSAGAPKSRQIIMISNFFTENFCLNMIQLIFLAASDVNMFYVEHQKTNNNKH